MTAAITAPRRVVTARPLNAETPLEALPARDVPAGTFFVRSNFDFPAIDPATWRLAVTGRVAHPLSLSLAELKSRPAKTLTVTLECAGNGRTAMTPVPPGTPWNFGAVATATFTGTPLAGVLASAGVEPEAIEALFIGADHGTVETGAQARFERSLNLAATRNEDVLLVWAMNGEPLEREHGAPVRLLVPGWYGVASVKWLTEIRLLDEPFTGFFQTDRYVYRGDELAADGTPVTRMRVRALIVEPAAGATLSAGIIAVRGAAWSGHGGIAKVELSVDGGASWSPAELEPASGPYALRPWRASWRAEPGRHVLLARATDAAGDVQPLTARSNELGYGNNGIHPVAVTVV